MCKIPMRLSSALVLVLLLAVGCGEDWSSPDWLQWKWGKKDTPTTPPSEMAAPAEESPPAMAAEEDVLASADVRSDVPLVPVTQGPHPSQLPINRPFESDWEPQPDPQPEEEPDPEPGPPPSPEEARDELEARLEEELASPESELTDPSLDDEFDLSGDLPEVAPDDVTPEEPQGGGDEDAAIDGGTHPALLQDISLDSDATDEAAVSVAAPGELVAASMVQVNGRFITVEDVLLGLHAKFMTTDALPDEMAFRQSAARLIQSELQRQVINTLVLIEAEGAMGERQEQMLDEEMDQTLRQMIAESGGSRQVLEQQCLERHTTLDDVLADHRRSLLTQGYLRQKIEPNMVVNRQMLLDFYRRHEEEFVQPRKVQMQLIAMPFDAFLSNETAEPTEQDLTLARSQAWQEIQRAKEEVQRGGDFGDVARQLSRGVKRDTGGVWPLMAEGSFRETEVQFNALRQGPGQMCGPIETDTGFYIVKTLEVVSGETVSFEDAQAQIEGILREEQYTQLSEAYFNELVGGATISESSQFMELAVDRATQRYWRP